MATKGEIHFNQEFKEVTPDGYKYVYGTTDRYAGDSVYIYYKPAMNIIKKVNVEDIERKLSTKLRSRMNRYMQDSDCFKNAYILDFQFSNKSFTPGIKSKLSLEVFIPTKQKFKTPDVYREQLRTIASELIGCISGEITDFANIY